MENVLATYNRQVAEVMSSRVSEKNHSGPYCLNGKAGFLMFFLTCVLSYHQSCRNIPMVVSNVRTISNLLAGLTCQELEDAVSGLNRIGHVTLVGGLQKFTLTDQI